MKRRFSFSFQSFSSIESISVSYVKKRFLRHNEPAIAIARVLQRRFREEAPPGAAPAVAAGYGCRQRRLNSWLSVLHAIPLVVQIVVGHLLSLVPTYVRLLVQRLS